MTTQASNAVAAVMLRLRHWVERGHLRRLDAAFASFVTGLDCTAGSALPVAAALLSRMESRGHTFLPLVALAELDSVRFGWPPELRDEIAALRSELPDGVEGWIAALGTSPILLWVEQQNAQDLGQPLVLEGARLYLRRFWRDERVVARAVQERCAAPDSVDASLVRAWIDRLFEPERGRAVGGAAAGPDWQRIACALALRGRLTVITGGPGTGKTYTAARLLALLFAMSPAPERLRVALAAPTGKAAARLRQSIDRSLTELQARLGDAMDLALLTRRIGGAQTLHALLGSQPDLRRFRHHAGNQLDVDVVIVDEASMIHLEMMAALLQAIAPQARLVLLGDKDQLASVEPGAVLGSLCAGADAGRYRAETVSWLLNATGETIPPALTKPSGEVAGPGDGAASGQALATLVSQQTVMLRRSRRFDGPIGELAQAVNVGTDPLEPARLIAGDTSGALWRPAGSVHASVINEVAVNGRPGADACYRNYCQIIAGGPGNGSREAHARWVRAVLEAFDRFRVLCAVREGPWGVEDLNQAIERALERAGQLRTGGAAWYPGRPVMVTRNDRALGVFNGDVGMTLPAHDSKAGLKVHFLDGDTLRSVSVARLSQIETAYAMTVHKSQGSEFEHTLLVLPARAGSQLLSRELVYTGITRARKALSLVAETESALAMAVSRAARG